MKPLKGVTGISGREEEEQLLLWESHSPAPAERQEIRTGQAVLNETTHSGPQKNTVKTQKPDWVASKVQVFAQRIVSGK